MMLPSILMSSTLHVKKRNKYQPFLGNKQQRNSTHTKPDPAANIGTAGGAAEAHSLAGAGFVDLAIIEVEVDLDLVSTPLVI